jgi:hypothetical protein
MAHHLARLVYRILPTDRTTSKKAFTNMNSNSGSSASNGSEKKPNHSTYNSFPLRTFHPQFLGSSATNSMFIDHAPASWTGRDPLFGSSHAFTSRRRDLLSFNHRATIASVLHPFQTLGLYYAFAHRKIARQHERTAFHTRVGAAGHPRSVLGQLGAILMGPGLATHRIGKRSLR